MAEIVSQQSVKLLGNFCYGFFFWQVLRFYETKLSNSQANRINFPFERSHFQLRWIYVSVVLLTISLLANKKRKTVLLAGKKKLSTKFRHQKQQTNPKKCSSSAFRNTKNRGRKLNRAKIVFHSFNIMK